MSLAVGVFSALSVLLSVCKVSSYYCDGGHFCATANECCEGGCCYTYPLQRPSPPAQPNYRSINIFVYNHWYFWSVVCALSALAGCAYWAWRRRARLCRPCCRTLARRSRASDRDSTGSCYLPPHYSRCSSFHRPPPPYNEVTSKPDLYPLVITYGDGDKGGGNYLMVHYFRNYIFRPSGSLSATSTADSLNSGFLINATNEANSMIPPPYSAENFDEWRGVRNVCTGRFAAPTRPGMTRSFSTMTYMEREHSQDNTPTQALPTDELQEDSSIVHAAYPGLIRLDLSPEPIEDRAFRASVLRATSRIAVENDLDDIPRLGYAVPCAEVPVYERQMERARNNNRRPPETARPRLGLSPETDKHTREDNAPVGEEVSTWRQLYDNMLAADLERHKSRSPPRPTSPTQLRREVPDPKAARAKMARRKTTLYMPLNGAATGQVGRVTRVSPGERSARFPFSMSAPTTPCAGGIVPTLLTLSHRMSGSVFSSRSSRLTREESDPLLENDERAPNLSDRHRTTDESF